MTLIGFKRSSSAEILNILYPRAGQKFVDDMAKHNDDEALLKKTECEYQTALMFTCPSRAPTSCFSPELLDKMNFWVFIKESDVPIFLRGGETCSVDK